LSLEAIVQKLNDTVVVLAVDSREDSVSFVTNGRSSGRKVHKTLTFGIDVPPHLWRAQCGFRFAYCGFTKHKSIDSFCERELCGK